MSFHKVLERLHHAAACRTAGVKVEFRMVLAKDLQELLGDFERLDAIHRANQPNYLEAVRQITKFKQFLEFVGNAPVASGVCCCGGSMDELNHHDHGAVDIWEHNLSLWNKEFEQFSGISSGLN